MHAKAYNHVYGINVDLKTVCALEPTIPEFAKQYFDYEAYARDLFSGDYWSDSGHVFLSNL